MVAHADCETHAGARVSTETTLAWRHFCAACELDEGSYSGCECIEEEKHLLVTGTVVRNQDGTDAEVTIEKVVDLYTGREWFAYGSKEEAALEDALYVAFEAEELKQSLALEHAKRLADALLANVELALSHGTGVERVREYLDAVKAAVLIRGGGTWK